MAVKIRPVTPDDYPFLYELLKQKRPEQNISHKKMPTWEHHVAFNEARPYLEDYIIEDDGVPVGRVYVAPMVEAGQTFHEVGIHVADSHVRRGIGSIALLQLLHGRKQSLLANVSPQNTASQEFFQRHGFRPLQYTYIWEPEE